MNKKESYVSPDILLVEIEPEGVLCDSGNTVSNPFGGLTEDEW